MSSPPCSAHAADQHLLALERHGVRDEAPAGSQRLPAGVEQARRREPAADEDRRPARSSPSSAAGARPRGRRAAARRAPARCALRAARARHAPRRRWRARVGSARSHSMPIEPLPAPTSHSSCAGRRCERGERDRADGALRDLAVVLVGVVGQPGACAAARRRPAARGIRSRRACSGSAARSPHSSAVLSTRRSAGPPSCSSTTMRLGPKPRSHSTRASSLAPAAPET